jgi:hypothetical protein
MLEAIVSTLRETWSGYVEGLRLVIPRLLAMLSVVAAGILIATLASAVTRTLLRFLRVGQLSERTGAAELLRKAELPPAERLVGSGVFWLVLLGFLLAGVDALGFETLEAMRAELALAVPRLLGALMILVIGLVLANVLRRAVLLAVVNAGWPQARLSGSIVHFLALAIVAAMVLDHLGLARPIVLAAFTIVTGAVALGLAIAVGIGAGPLLRRALEERFGERRPPGSDGASHL